MRPRRLPAPPPLSRNRPRRHLSPPPALLPPDLSPAWTPIPWPFPGAVLKAPASCANSGVTLLPTSEYVERLRLYAPDLASCGVLEEFIPGPQFEWDGVRVSGRIHTFHPLRQTWNGDRIVSYHRVPEPPGLCDALTRALDAINLDDAPFCAELRYHGGWKVIDLHCRLGEGDGLPEAMSDVPPLEQVERWVTETVAKEG